MVKEIKFYPQNGKHSSRLPGQSVVRCSNDRINYTTVFEGILCQDIVGWQTIDINNLQNNSGKYWRVEINNTVGNASLVSVGEMIFVGY